MLRMVGIIDIFSSGSGGGARSGVGPTSGTRSHFIMDQIERLSLPSHWLSIHVMKYNKRFR